MKNIYMGVFLLTFAACASSRHHQSRQPSSIVFVNYDASFKDYTKRIFVVKKTDFKIDLRDESYPKDNTLSLIAKDKVIYTGESNNMDFLEHAKKVMEEKIQKNAPNSDWIIIDLNSVNDAKRHAYFAGKRKKGQDEEVALPYLDYDQIFWAPDKFEERLNELSQTIVEIQSKIKADMKGQ